MVVHRASPDLTHYWRVNLATNKITTPNDDPVLRHEIGREASGQIGSLLNMLKREAQQGDEGFRDVLSAGLRRIEELNDIAFYILDGNTDEDTTNRVIYPIVYGTEMEASHG